MFRLKTVAAALAVVVGMCANSWAQVGGGQLVGVVTDEQHAVVPGATITITSESTTFSRVTVSAGDGGFVATGLAPGQYRIDVALNGFRPLKRDGITVATGAAVRVELELTAGQISEAVVVTADAPLLRETGNLGTVIDHEKVVQLPLNGRTFIGLAGLAPGVALPPNSAFPRINGGRPRTNEYLFDGISVLQPEPGQVAYYPIVDSIQEFKIESNSPPAEFGRFNGGVVNLTTKAGSNLFHGTGFEFFRNKALNERNYFQAANTDKPEYSRNQFGGILGGPLVKDRTFFFADYQGQRQTIGRTVISTVPTALQRQGIFTEAIGGRVPAIFDPATGSANRTAFANGTIPESRWDPVAKALLARFPMPTSAGTANNYRRTDNETVDQNQFTGRLDQRLSAGEQVFARLAHFVEDFTPVTPLPDGSGTTTGTLGPQHTSSWSLASSYQKTLSPTMLNELRIGDTRRHVDRTAATLSGTASSTLGLPGIPTTARFPNTLPTFSIAGYQILGSPTSTATDFGTSVTEIADSFSWLKGKHAIKVGADIRWERLNVIQPASPTGQFTFAATFTDQPGTANTGTPLASFLLGQVSQFQIDLQQDVIRNRAHIQEYFVQDDWRATDWLTVNAGLRYTLNFPSYEVNNQAAVFNLTTQQLDFLGRDGNPRAARELHKDNFGPRLGVAARLNDRTVLKAGYGVIWIEMAGITTPFTTPVFPFLQTVSQRSLDNIVPAFTLASGPTVAQIPLTANAGLGQGVFSVSRDLESGYAQQWNVSLQRELSTNISAEVAYTGSIISRIGIPDYNINQLTVEQLALGSQLTTRVANPYFGIIPRSSSLGDPTIPYAQLIRPYPQYTSVSLYRNNVGSTEYRAISAKLEQRLTQGLSYLVSYTRSRLLDDASSVFDASILTGPVTRTDQPADSYNRSLERDYSTGDIPHVFAASTTYALPWGRGQRSAMSGITGALVNDWMVTGILTLQSGVPVAVTQATNNNSAFGFGIQRPNVTGDTALPADQRTAAKWFNTDAFSTAPQFTLGSASRNPVRGPNYKNLDLAVIRRVSLPSSASLEFRLEIFNALNTTQFGAPNGSFGSAAFGSITTALDPRVIQLGAKVSF